MELINYVGQSSEKVLRQNPFGESQTLSGKQSGSQNCPPIFEIDNTALNNISTESNQVIFEAEICSDHETEEQEAVEKTLSFMDELRNWAFDNNNIMFIARKHKY